MRYFHTLTGRILAIFVMAVFALNMSVLPALAQDQAAEQSTPPGEAAAESATADTPPGETAPAEESVAAEVEALSVPNEVVQDSTVTAADLGVSEQNVLPGDFLYPLKDGWREVKHAFTFSDVGDAKLDLQYSSEKLIEAQKLAAEGSMENLEKAIDNYQEEIGDFNAEMDDIAAGDQDSAAIEALQGDAVNAHIEQTVILDSLEEAVSEETFIEIRDAKNDASEGVAKALTLSGEEQNGQAWQQLIADAATRGEGSSLKNLKVLEVLKAVEEKVPEEAREAIEGAQDNILKKFEKDFKGIPEEVRLKKMEGYMRHMKGDETNRLRMLDMMKFDAKELPPEVLQRIEGMKAKAVEHFNDRMKKFATPEAREKMFEHLQRGDLESVRVLDDLKTHALDEEVRQKIEVHHTEGIAKFREAFRGDEKAQGVADRAEQLMRQVRDNPDPKTFRLLEELRGELTPEQQEFVGRMENAGKEEMEKRFSEEREKFMSRMSSINPEDLAYMGDFKRDFAPGLGAEFSRDFGQTIEFSKEGIKDRVRSFERPEDVEKFRQVFEAGVTEEGKRAVQGSIPNFDSFVQEQRGEVEAKFRMREEFIRENRGSFKEGGASEFGGDREAFEQQMRDKFREQFGKDFGIAPGEQNFDPVSFPGGGATGGQFPGQGATQGQFPGRGQGRGQESQSNIPSDAELKKKIERENPGLNEQERKAFVEREKKQMQEEQKRETQQQRSFPGGGATGGQFPGGGATGGQFPGGGTFTKPDSGGSFRPGPSDGSFTQPTGGEFRSPSGGFSQPAGGSAPSGGTSAPPPGPTSFDPLGAIGAVLGVFVSN